MKRFNYGITALLFALAFVVFITVAATQVQAQTQPPEPCLSLDCVTPPIEVPGLEGAWYDPENSGYGVFIDDSQRGTFVAWFTYDFRYFPEGQAWYVGNNGVGDGLTFTLVRPTGSFPSVGYSAGEGVAWLTIERLDIDVIEITWKFIQEEPCVTPRVSPSPPECEGSAILTRFYPAD